MTLLQRLSLRAKAFIVSFAGLALAGLFAATHMPVALFPQVSFPRIVVSIDAGDRPADQMLASVTIPTEEALRAVPGVRNLRSKTSRGSAELSLDFAWGEDMTSELLLTESAMSQLAPDLPPGTRFVVRRMDPTVFPVVALSLVSDLEPTTRLWERAYFDLRPELLSVDGVARVELLGGAREELQVIVDPNVLVAAGVSIEEVAAAVAKWSTIEALGRIEDLYRLDLVITAPQIAGARDLEALVVRTDALSTTRLGDVATIKTAPEPVWTRVTADGRDAVLVQVYQQPAGNTVAISADVARVLAEARRHLPAGDTLSVWYDQSDLISASAASVRDAVILGTILAALVLLFFLRSLKLTLIAILVVPSVLASTCLLLYVLGQSLNIMTLGGMAAAVGLIIDDAIVVVEHIVSRLRAEPENQPSGHRSRVLAAAGEFSRPLLGASLATIVINIPPVFLTGVTGEFFKALSLTMALGLIISFLVAYLAVPVLSAGLLGAKDAEREDAGPVFRVVQAIFEWSLRLMIRARWLALIACIVWIVAGWRAFAGIPTGFMPPMDEGGFVLDYIAAPGTSLSETDRIIRQVETVLRETPEVVTYSRRTGAQLGGGLTEANEGDFFVRLAPPPRRGIEEIMADVRHRIQQQVPGLDVELLQLMEDLIGDLTAVPQPIEVKLSASDPTVLDAEAVRVADELAKLPGIVDVNDGLNIAGDALEVRIDPLQASVFGVDPASANEQIRTLLAGSIIGTIIEQPKVISIRLWSRSDKRAIEDDVGDLRLATAGGATVLLRQIASIGRVSGQPTISRDGLRPTVSVTARTEGVDLGGAVRAVRAALDAPGALSPGVSYRLGGLWGEQQRAFRSLLAVFAAAIGLLFALVLFMYESIRVALLLTLAALMTMPGVAIGLRLTGTELNISSMMGFAMIVGAAAEIGVFYLSEVYRRSDGGMVGRAAIVAAAVARLRPISMTSLAAIFAMLPLALDIGEGAAMLRPLAIAIISGLAVQVPIILGLLPALLVVAHPRSTGGSKPER